MDIRNQPRESELELPDSTSKIGESASVGQPRVFEAIEVFAASVLPQAATVVRTCDIAKKRAVVINHLLSNPNEPATPAWREFIVRNFKRIKKFARTAKNKGRDLDPEFLK